MNLFFRILVVLLLEVTLGLGYALADCTRDRNGVFLLAASRRWSSQGQQRASGVRERPMSPRSGRQCTLLESGGRRGGNRLHGRR